MGLGTTLATTPFYLTNSNIPFPLIVFAFILFSGALYGLLWSISLLFKDLKKFKSEFKEMNHSHASKLIKILSLIIVILFIIGILVVPLSSTVRIYSSIIILLFLIYPYLFIGVKALENIHLYTFLPIEKIVEGDWIAKDIKKNNKVVFNQKNMITKKRHKETKRIKYKKSFS